jgi:hypothetical protein
MSRIRIFLHGLMAGVIGTMQAIEIKLDRQPLFTRNVDLLISILIVGGLTLMVLLDKEASHD